MEAPPEQASPGDRLRRLLQRPAVWGYAWKGLNALASFAAAAALARLAGAEAVGDYGLALATAAILATVGQRGLDQVFLRVAGGDLRQGDTASAHAALRTLGRRIAAGAGATAALLLLLAGPGPLAGLLAADRASLLAAALGVVTLPALRLALALARAAGRPAFAQFLEALPSLLFLPAVLGAAALGITLSGARTVLLYFGAQAAAVLLGVPALARLISGWAPPAPPPDLRPMLRAGLPIMATALLLAFQDWFLLAAATRGLSSAEAGALRLSLQLMLVPAFIWQVGDSLIVGPLAGDLREGRADVAWRRFGRTVRRSLLLAAPVIALFVLAPGEVLRLMFGEPYVAAGPAVALMALGQLALISTHPVGALLVMAGREPWLLLVLGVSTAVLVAATLGLLPAFGLAGIGAAYAASCLARSVLAFSIARRFVRPA